MLEIEKRAHAVWGETWRVARADLEVVMAPAIGRLVFLGRPGGPNALWVNPEAPLCPVGGWTNWGGEKLWFWPQAQWPRRMAREWPPPEVPVPASSVWMRPDGIEWMVPAIEGFGGPVTRRLRLDAVPGGPVRLLHQTEPGPDAPQLWNVVQVARPAIVWAGTPGEARGQWRRMGGPESALVPEWIGERGWRLSCPGAESGKVVLDASCLSAATPAGTLTIRVEPAAGEPAHVDPVERAQVFIAGDASGLFPAACGPYAELEFVAPPGARQWEQVWSLDTETACSKSLSR